MPRGKSCTVSNCHVANIMPHQCFGGGQRPFSNKKILQGFFQFFLQGRKPKLPQITGTKIIFKPKTKKQQFIIIKHSF